MSRCLRKWRPVRRCARLTLSAFELPTISARRAAVLLVCALARCGFRESTMTRKKRMTDSLAKFRQTIDADDGADPSQLFKKEGFTDRTGRKSHQLCAQVADTLTQIFGGECGDAVLQSLTVLDVAPAPDASQLL